MNRTPRRSQCDDIRDEKGCDANSRCFWMNEKCYSKIPPPTSPSIRLDIDLIPHEISALIQGYIQDDDALYLLHYEPAKLYEMMAHNNLTPAQWITLLKHTSILDEWGVGVPYRTAEQILQYAALTGDIEAIHIAIEQLGAARINTALVEAPRGGRIGIVRILLDKYYAHDLNGALDAAARGGHIAIVELMLDRGADSCRSLEQAAASGNIPTIELILRRLPRCAYRYNDAMASAARAGHMDAVELFLRLGADDYDYAFVEAAFYGYRDIMELMMRLGNITYLSEAMAAAVSTGQTDIAEWMMQLGADNYDMALRWAAASGNMSMVEWMLRLDATDYNGALNLAAESGHAEIAQMMIDLGANTFRQALENAANNNHDNVVAVLEPHLVGIQF